MNRRLLCLLSLLLASPLAGAQSILLEEQGALAGDRYGFAVSGGFDLDQDGHDDLAVGNPYADTHGLVDNGEVQVLSGRSGALLFTHAGLADDDHLGWSLALTEDMNGDGSPELMIGAPNALVGSIRPGRVLIVSTSTWTVDVDLSHSSDGAEFGYAVAGGVDWDQDGTAEYAIGLPGNGGGWVELRRYPDTMLGGYGHGGSNARMGEVLVLFEPAQLAIGAPGAFGNKGEVLVGNFVGGAWTTLSGTVPGARFGDAVAAVPDLTGDGVDELLIAAPRDATHQPLGGVVSLVSSQNGGAIATWAGETDAKLGSSLAFLGDVVGGPELEFVAGAPAKLVGGIGSARVFSLSSAVEHYRVSGPAGANFGASLANVGDVNRDGFPDFAVGATLAEQTASPALSNVGLLRVHSGGGPGIVGYCTAGTSASGCTPGLTAWGAPSETLSSGFFLDATALEGSAFGQFFFGSSGRQASPWGNGTSFQCVVPPVKRGGLLKGAGTNGQCDGWLLQDLNARWCSSCPKAHHNPGVGAVVQAQLWYRDPNSTSNQTTSLTNAVEFVVGP